MAEPITLEAQVVASIRELRFSFGGAVESFSAEVGKIVSAGEIIGRLKREELTKKRQLKLEAYNKMRATFEQVKKKLEGDDDPDKKYLMDRAKELDALSDVQLDVFSKRAREAAKEEQKRLDDAIKEKYFVK